MRRKESCTNARNTISRLFYLSLFRRPPGKQKTHLLLEAKVFEGQF